ncbi:MAG: hypothetical protein AB4372_32085 [Xenococcus sp. (in: cyanobacteria)]
MTNQPKRGSLKDLWELLEPNKGYFRDQVMTIAHDYGLEDSTVYNLLNKQRGYVIYNDKERLYYRSDSTFHDKEYDKPISHRMSHNLADKSKTSNSNGQKSIIEVINEIERDLSSKKNQKEQILQQKRDIELREEHLENEITQLEHSLMILQQKI